MTSEAPPRPNPFPGAPLHQRRRLSLLRARAADKRAAGTPAITSFHRRGGNVGKRQVVAGPRRPPACSVGRHAVRSGCEVARRAVSPRSRSDLQSGPRHARRGPRRAARSRVLLLPQGNVDAQPQWAGGGGAARQQRADGNLLVVVDQFEELFRFQRSAAETQESAVGFVKLLLAATRQTETPIYVAITMRSDYLGDWRRSPALRKPSTPVST